MRRGVLFLHHVTVSIPHLVSVEARSIDPLAVFGSIATMRHGASIAVVRMEVVVYIAMKVLWSVKPWADADEYATIEPLRTVVAGRSTSVRRDIVVAVRAIGGNSDLDADLSIGLGSGGHNSHSKGRRYNCVNAHWIHLTLLTCRWLANVTQLTLAAVLGEFASC